MSITIRDANKHRYNFDSMFIKCLGAAATVQVASTVMKKSLEFLNYFDECRELDIHSSLWDRFSGINLLSKVSRTVASLLAFSAPAAFGYRHYRKASTLSEKCAGIAFVLLGVGAAFLLYNTEKCGSIIYPYAEGQYAELCGRIRTPIYFSS